MKLSFKFKWGKRKYLVVLKGSCGLNGTEFDLFDLLSLICAVILDSFCLVKLDQHFELVYISEYVFLISVAFKKSGYFHFWSCYPMSV